HCLVNKGAPAPTRSSDAGKFRLGSPLGTIVAPGLLRPACGGRSVGGVCIEVGRIPISGAREAAVALEGEGPLPPPLGSTFGAGPDPSTGTGKFRLGSPRETTTASGLLIAGCGARSCVGGFEVSGIAATLIAPPVPARGIATLPPGPSSST